MSATRSEQNSQDDSLVTLLDERQMAIDEVIEDARRRRSQAIGAMIRSLFGLGSPAAITAPVVGHIPHVSAH